MASFVTDIGALNIQTGGAITWSSDTIKARLVASSATPLTTSTTMTGLTGIGTDQTLASKTLTSDGTNHRTNYGAASPTWSTVSIGSTVGWVVVYKFVTNDAGSTPIAVLDVTDTPTNGSDITITFDATGIFYLQQ